jgi:hypothetical protein
VKRHLVIPFIALLWGAAGCGEKAEITTTGPGTTTEPTGASTGTSEGSASADAAAADDGGGLTRSERKRREVERAVDRYVAALDARDGAALCDLLAPGALELVELPRERGSCGRSFDASIGYRDPRGLPVFAGASVTGFVSTEVDGAEARATATVVTEFADRDEPSVEDDVVYLERRGGRWLVAKASSALYRAVGIADIPPQVLTPPR